MQTLKIDRSRYTLSPTRDAGAFAEKLRKCTGKTKLSPIKSDRRVYPKFSAGDSTAEYVHRYWVANGFSDDHRKFFAPLNTEPATLYSGEDTHETVDDFELCAPVESIETAPDDIAQPEPAAVESAPDVPIEQPAAPVIEQPAPVDVWPPLQPMMRPAEHIARLPLFARLAIERIDADSDLRTGAKLDELLRAYAAQYRETCDDYTRQSAHAIASRRFWNFRPDDAPTEPAAIVPAADPAPVCEPVESPALQATRAHPWMTHAARRVYWVHCETARFSRELGPLPFGAMFRRPRSPGFMPDFLAPEIRAHRAAVAAAVRADRAAKRAPADAPRADPAPVDTGAAPGGWMRPATGMLSESETRAWPSAEPVESAPTPGYAFPADALPATHSDAAEPAPADRMAAAKFARQSAILEKLIRCDGQVMTRRAFLHSKIRDGLRLTVEQHDRIAPMSRMATFRASNEEQRAHDRRILAAGKKDVFFIGGFEITKTEFDYASEILAGMAPAADPAPVPGDSDPVPVNSAAPVDPDDQKPGESAEKRARIEALAETVAAGSGSIGFTHPSDPARYGIAGPDMSGRGAFRFTYFDAVGPIGDAIRPSLADAIAAGVEYGFTVDAAPLEWPDNPAPDAAPVPVPVNSADVDAVEVARLVAKFRQFADERRRTGDTLAAAIRVESAEARYRADSLTAPNAFRDAPGAGHEAAKAHDTRRAAEYRAAAAELDRLADAMPADDAAPVATHSAPIAEPVRYCIHRLRRVHDEINATRATTTTARGRRWVRIMNALRSLMSEHPERRAPVPADIPPGPVRKGRRHA